MNSSSSSSNSKPRRTFLIGPGPISTPSTSASGGSMAATATNSSMKFLRDLLARILNGESASDILTGLDPMNKGHTGEALLRLLTLFGIHPTDPSAIVVPYHVDPDHRRLEPILTLSERLAIVQHGLINAGGSNKIDICWGDGTTRAVCSSKIGMKEIKSIADLQIVDMLVQFTNSGGYTEGGRSVSAASIMAYVLVDNSTEVLALAERSKASNQVTKDNLNCLDVSDLNRMCAVFRSRIKGCESKDPETILGHLLSDEKASLRLRFHQILICSKILNQIALGKKTLLIGALPRSGKTWMGAWIAKHFRKILIITTRPGETRGQWNRVFNSHREFSKYRVIDLNSTTSAAVAMTNTKNESIVAIASTQFFKMAERDSLKGLDWDLVLLDEIHEGGSTDLTGEMLDTYIGTSPIRIMMTATYTKPVHYFMIPSECCFFWDLEDVRLMRTWTESGVFDRLCAKYGYVEVTAAREMTYASGETDASILASYTNAPRLAILSTIMQQDIYDQMSGSTAGTAYGFSMRSLFMTTADGKAFQNQKAVDTFLALLSGSDKMRHYKAGDMSMFARILRYWKTTEHRAMDEFMTQIWFLPSGTGQLLENVKGAMMGRIQANPLLKNFATLTLDSGMGDISKAVSNAVVDAKGLGKKGLILLTGNVGSLGVSLPEVDVALMLHDIGSADMNYQQMMRVGTEMFGKRMGLIIDFNVWRVLTTLNAYATSRCGQANKSSADRINWCISHLIDVDPDMWDCPESPMTVPKETIAERLTQEWRRMLEETGSSLSDLARKPFDLGEDQKLLDRIAIHVEEGTAKSSIEVNEDQEALDDGIEVKSCSNSSTSDSKSEKEETEKKEEESIVKKANLNDVLSRLIPEFAILSGCQTDLLQAIRTILNVPTQHAAMNEFLIDLYSQYKGASSASHSPLSILGTLVQRHYENLKDAREIFEVISNRMSTLDNPKELIAFLGQHLKPKEKEKKENGEVFTPPDLIQQKFDKLTLACPDIWSNPSRRFLDPANGIGNYPALAFHRLMDGLKVTIPNDADRKKHILEKMLFMCELNAKNVEVSRKIFDPKDELALNLYQGSYLDLDPKKVWGVEKFDVIFGNPPYNPKSNGKKGGKSLWPIFVEKSINLLKVNGFLVFVHPALWRKPENELHNLMFGKQFHYLSIHSKQEGDKVFSATTRFDWYILQNTSPTLPVSIRFDDGVSSSLMITPSLPFIVNHGGDVMEKMRNKSPFGFLLAERSSEGHSARDYVGKVKTTANIYPLINGSSKMRGIRLCWSSKPLKYQYSKKVIFSNGEVIQPFYDSGKFGTTEGGIFIPVDSDTDGVKLTRFLKSKLVSYIVGATKWSNFETNKQIFWSIPHPKDLPDNFTDAQVYTYFGLTPEEIGRIEANQRGFGLTDYVALEAPEVSVPPPPASVVEPVGTNSSSSSSNSASASAKPDYSKLSNDALKQLCRDRKLKGFSGKNKEGLIALLSE